MTVPLPTASRSDIFPLPSPGGEVTVLTIQEAECGMGHHDRRDVFKCVLVLHGANELHYATRSYGIDRPALVFTNHLVPFSWEPVESTGEQGGYIVAFTEPFLHSAMRGISLKESVLYRVDGNPRVLPQRRAAALPERGVCPHAPRFRHRIRAQGRPVA